VSNFDHFVTQWMSFVIVSRGSAWNSSYDHERGSSISPPMAKLQEERSGRGVGPAERTGKPRSRY